MSALSRWFSRPSRPTAPAHTPGDWRKEVEALEAEAEQTPLAFQGTPLNRAGDICLRAGDQQLALSYYGRAIDALLEDGQREAARGVANKIIRVHPEAVRTLCTLTWLDLAARHMATALLHLRDYVTAAKSRGQEAITADQIKGMARVTPQEEFLAAAADSLDQLGFTERAAAVREWLKGDGSPDVITDAEELAVYCLNAAIGSNAFGSDGA